jgi:hypothetical protein
MYKFRRVIFIGADLFAYWITVFMEINLFLHLYAMLGVGFDDYNLTMMSMELPIIAFGAFLSVLAEGALERFG